MRDYREDIKVDLNALEICLKEQAEAFLYWAEKHANAIAERDKIRQQLDVKKAEFDAEIRKNSLAFGLEKVTEAAMPACITRQPLIIEISQQLIEAIRVVNLCAASVEGLNHRKKALEALSQLYIAGYWAKPRVSEKDKEILGAKETREERHNLVQEQKEKLTKRLRR